MNSLSRTVVGSGPIVFCALALFAAGCGGDSRQSSTDFQPNQMPKRSLPDAQEAALRTHVFCGSPDEDCNPSVSMLIATTNGSLGSCTASLISNDVAVTNSHCIPEDLKAEGLDCSGRIYLFFPRIGAFPAERAECSQIIRTSKIDRKSQNPDYAFIRLKSGTLRPALSGFSNDGFHENVPYTVTKVDPGKDRGAFYGRLVRTKCTAMYASSLLPRATNADSPVMSFRDCAVEHGNSGGPILDADGNLRGLIQATLEHEAFNAKLLAQQTLDGTVARLGIGTNLACVEFPDQLFTHEIPTGCAQTPEMIQEETAKVAPALVAKLEKAFIPQAAPYLGKLTDVFEWEAATLTQRSLFSEKKTYLLLPKCFKPARGWVSDYENFFGRTRKSVTKELELPYWTPRIGLNQYLQLDVQVASSPGGSHSTEIEFRPKDFETTGSAHVRVKDRESSGILGNTYILDKTLTACP
jgi:hypothetical protein